MIKLPVRVGGAIAATIVTVGLATVGAVPANAGNPPIWGCGLIYDGSSEPSFLDDYGGGSGTYVHTYTETDSVNQTWCLEGSGNGWHIHPLNNVGLCLDAHTDNNGQKIWVYTCNGTGPQQWNWNFNGGYLVRATNSQMALHDNGLHNIVTIQSGGNPTWTFDLFEYCTIYSINPNDYSCQP